jgi:hypothetical protein
MYHLVEATVCNNSGVRYLQVDNLLAAMQAFEQALLVMW